MKDGAARAGGETLDVLVRYAPPLGPGGFAAAPRR